MKPPLLLLLLFFAILNSNLCFSQDGLWHYVNSDIDSIISKSKKATILIGPEEYAGINTVSLKDHPNEIILKAYYYIYQVDKKICIQKYIETISAGFAKSKPLQVPNDTLLKWVEQNDSLMRTEQILPYVYQDTLDGKAVYKIGSLLHSFPFSMTVFNNQSNHNYSFDKIAMQKFMFDGDTGFQANMNYQFNSSTLIFKAYKILKNILESSFEKFNFSD